MTTLIYTLEGVVRITVIMYGEGVGVASTYNMLVIMKNRYLKSSASNSVDLDGQKPHSSQSLLRSEGTVAVETTAWVEVANNLSFLLEFEVVAIDWAMGLEASVSML